MKIKNLIIFISGVAIGSAITYKLVSDKYENLIDDEIESVKESLGYYTKKDNSDDEKKPTESEDEEKVVYEPLKTDKKDYENLIAYHNYHAGDNEEDDKSKDSFIELHKIEKSNEHSFSENVYVIPPYEYGSLTDYDQIELTYYNDGVLCDDMNEVVEDVDFKVGRDFMNHFDEYDVTVVHVRNDIYKCDYEISKDIRDYSDAVWGTRPPHYTD